MMCAGLLIALVAACPAAVPSAQQRALDLSQQAAARQGTGDLVGALDLVTEAFTLDPDPGYAMRAAELAQALGLDGLAHRYYRLYVDVAPRAADRDDIIEHIAALEQELVADHAQLSVESSPSGAIVEIGTAWGTHIYGETPLAAFVDPVGPVTVRARLLGYEDAEVVREFRPGRWEFIRDGDLTLLPLPSPPGAFETDVVQEPTGPMLIAGEHHASLLLETGRVTCWGNDRTGQLGDGAGVSRDDHAAYVAGLVDAEWVSSMGGTTCALRANGDVVCWGANGGMVAVPSPVFDAPTRVVEDTDYRALASGSRCGITPVGRIECWSGGANRHAPPLVQVSHGHTHSCGRTPEGTVRCWGREHGGHGLGAVSNPREPVEGIVGAIDISTGFSHSCAIDEDGVVLCWGSNGHGQLGNDDRTIERRRSRSRFRIRRARSRLATKSPAQPSMEERSGVGARGRPTFPPHGTMIRSSFPVRSWGSPMLSKSRSGTISPVPCRARRPYAGVTSTPAAPPTRWV